MLAFPPSRLDSAHHVGAVATASARSVLSPACSLLPEVVELDEVRSVPIRQELGANLEEVFAVHAQSLDEVPDILLRPPLEDVVVGEWNVQKALERLSGVVVAVVEFLDCLGSDAIPRKGM